ncbi:uncharacterized protein PG986_007469 [Apiospora aurea]|uniref:Protein HRI1 n=1 Tax=Apiospora aurea TaxID=335848 RepID=A0ABR1QCN2_9PEZI
MSHEENKPSVSVRKYIKWGDTFPVENTSTIVLTSPKRHFADVRLRIPIPTKEEAAAGSAVIRDPSRLDWAFAGTSSHDAAASPPHSVFRHWVDSRHRDAEAVVDEGDMVPSPQPGETIESGRMVNPDTGRMQAYEECWLDEEPGPGAASAGWVLRHHDEGRAGGGGARGVMVKIGSRVQGVLRVGGEVAVGRWEVVPGSPSSWMAIAEIGSLANTGFPTGLPAAGPASGDKVQAQDGRQWGCLESW